MLSMKEDGTHRGLRTEGLVLIYLEGVSASLGINTDCRIRQGQAESLRQELHLNSAVGVSFL